MILTYYLFDWKPPELSQSEKILLGKEIASIGRKAFVRALRTRLTDVRSPSNNKSFTIGDVLKDVRNPVDLRTAPAARSKAVVGTVILAAMFIVLAAFCVAFPPLLIGIALTARATFGSMGWMNRKIDRWAQSLVDEYSHAVANEIQTQT